jgi:ElaB/YqjD/DUF883 family membrane-anchored ribosome-binding protein
MSAAERETAATGDASTRNPEEIREDIEQTRGELGETVAAVAEKTDVKKQARAKTDELKDKASAKAEKAKAKAADVGEKAKEAAPESVSEGAQKAQQLVEQNPTQFALAGAFIAGLLLGKLLSR